MGCEAIPKYRRRLPLNPVDRRDPAAVRVALPIPIGTHARPTAERQHFAIDLYHRYSHAWRLWFKARRLGLQVIVVMIAAFIGDILLGYLLEPAIECQVPIVILHCGAEPGGLAGPESVPVSR